jgi:spermidine/putrescine transport system ATP-binding protein
VRPEKIDLGTEPSLPGRCPVGGIVTEVVCFGTSTKISVTTAAGGDIVVFRQNPASAGAVAARDDAVWLWWQPEHSCPIG